ncbi:MAG: class I SAM-dependent methyltransferase [Desulfobaccales bacterium]
MAKAFEVKGADLPHRLYARLCGRELTASLLHFQFLPAFYARRDIRRDGPRLRGRVLDVGCGNQPYRPFLPPEVEYVALDYPFTQAGLHPRVRPGIYGDARTLPFADQSFDAVLCFQVLEHVDRPEAVIRELARVLKPGGLGLLSAPFCYNLHMEPYDFYRFSPYGVKALLESHGLAVRELRGQGGIGTLVVQMFHNWLFSGLSRQARRSVWARALAALMLPLLLILAAFNNLTALALDFLNRKDLRFTPNLWVVAEKT